MTRFYTIVASPVGELTLVAGENGLVAVLWENDKPERVRTGAVVEDARHPVLVETARQLGEYFDGRRRAFDLALDFVGTPFQRQVWAALLAIPYGETRSYGQLAETLGRPSAARAVGAANGRNPISIITPCHRLIGANGDLTGFAGGLDNKRFLLALEAARG
ncbi:cysteine methyltransferase [Metarhizobium album]|uniref:Methylated-DNA--protein-cysteine methyltransferase n=1 Tax=Metarhizobium album TaxID=2182425 RepID=A0A2U2DJP5_9HYPH|nr:methylated-DNA--[protein]-cysteine S-methyltransferase [Rhizobium album]PWE53524.1 cysteine methyltransferase [Rhizobium album]